MLTVIERAQGMSNGYDLLQSGWKSAPTATNRLYNMLISCTKGEAQIMLENSGPEHGFKCWGKMIQHYDPQGEDNELTSINMLLAAPLRAAQRHYQDEACERERALHTDRTLEALP